MKLAIFLLITIVATAGALAMPTSSSWMPRDARPEAVIIGAGLIVLASILRHASPQKKSVKSVQ